METKLSNGITVIVLLKPEYKRIYTIVVFRLIDMGHEQKEKSGG